MGVMPCNVSGCSNILCNKYHPKHGYICYSCFERLIKLGVSTNIEEFFTTPVDDNDVDEEASRAYFETLFWGNND